MQQTLSLTRKIVWDNALWPFASLWLAKTYEAPADLYGSQIWNLGFFCAKVMSLGPPCRISL